MTNNVLISIIVPVYNVSSFLIECLESIVSQTYKKIEVLLIDDGSTDCSGEICDRYSQDYEFVKTFHKANGGLSSARNYGINNAHGDYVCFVDSDDMINAYYVERLLRALLDYNADLAMCRFIKAKECKWNNSIDDIHIIDNPINSIDINDVNTTVVWNKLYSKKFFSEYNLRFEEGKIHEDMFFSPQVILNAKRIAILDDSLYFYRDRENSIMSSAFSDKRLDIFDASLFRADLFKTNNLHTLYITECEGYVRKSKEYYKYINSGTKKSEIYRFKIINQNKQFLHDKTVFNYMSIKYKCKLLLFLIFRR